MNSVLTENSLPSAGVGGAIFSRGVTTVTNTTFARNTAHTGHFPSGGAIYNEGMLTVTNSTFTDNSTSGRGSDGGAIANSGTASIEQHTGS